MTCIKITISYNGKRYIGYEETDTIEETEQIIIKSIKEKGYYMLRTMTGEDVMFPKHALIKSEVLLSIHYQ